MSKKKIFRKPVLKDLYPHMQRFKKVSTKMSERYILDDRVTEEFMEVLATLSLEEIIALKVEKTSQLYGGKLFGLPLWSSISYIIKESVYMYSVFCTNSKKEAMMLLGLDARRYGQLEARYKEIQENRDEF